MRFNGNGRARNSRIKLNTVNWQIAEKAVHINNSCIKNMYARRERERERGRGGGGGRGKGEREGGRGRKGEGREGERD